MAGEKNFCDGLSWSHLAEYTPADDTDCGYQNKMRAWVPDTTGTVVFRKESGGSTITFPVIGGALYPIHDIYSFDATGTDSTYIQILG